jgi:hypothetical protein
MPPVRRCDPSGHGNVERRPLHGVREKTTSRRHGEARDFGGEAPRCPRRIPR